MVDRQWWETKITISDNVSHHGFNVSGARKRRVKGHQFSLNTQAVGRVNLINIVPFQKGTRDINRTRKIFDNQGTKFESSHIVAKGYVQIVFGFTHDIYDTAWFCSGYTILCDRADVIKCNT